MKPRPIHPETGPCTKIRICTKIGNPAQKLEATDHKTLLTLFIPFLTLSQKSLFK